MKNLQDVNVAFILFRVSMRFLFCGGKKPALAEQRRKCRGVGRKKWLPD
jgi:hypothetical protein